MTLPQRRLLDRARRARRRAAARFSRFKVGAALETRRGRVYEGANIENASYGLTLCAERVAIFKAVNAGERRFRRIAVVADTERLTAPCGACRQIIWEFCGDIEVLMGNLKGKSAVFRMSELLPHPFDRRQL